MLRKSPDLILAGGLALASLLAVFTGHSIQTPVALPLALVLPGYCSAAALFPPRSLTTTERLLLIPSLSIAITALGGLLLHWMPWGLDAEPWTVMLGGVTFITSAAALFRRSRQGVCERRGSHPGLKAGQALLFVLAALVIGGAVVIARFGAEQQLQTSLTQLWILPPSLVGEQSFQLGIVNLEDGETTYRLLVYLGGAIYKEWPSIPLKPGEEWSAKLLYPPGQPALQPVEARLYRVDAPDTLYRSVILKQGTR